MNVNDIENANFEDLAKEISAMLRVLSTHAKPKIVCCAVLTSRTEGALILQNDKTGGPVSSIGLTLLAISKQDFLSAKHSDALCQIAKEFKEEYDK